MRSPLLDSRAAAKQLGFVDAETGAIDVRRFLKFLYGTTPQARTLRKQQRYVGRSLRFHEDDVDAAATGSRQHGPRLVRAS